MPKSYLSRLDAVKTPKTRRRDRAPDDMMTAEEHKRYLKAKQDLQNGVNIVSWEEIQKKYAQ